MIVYRIAKKNRIEDLSGKGAELSGGRWNEKGTPALYTSTSLALCFCEILVHVDKDLFPKDMYYAEINIPDNFILDVTGKKLDETDSVIFGTNWLKEKQNLALKVPSVIMPKEYKKDFNIIINPLHKKFNKVVIQNINQCIFDKRFFL